MHIMKLYLLLEFTHGLYQYMFNLNILFPKRYSNNFTCVIWQGILIIDVKFHYHLSSFTCDQADKYNGITMCECKACIILYKL